MPHNRIEYKKGDFINGFEYVEDVGKRGIGRNAKRLIKLICPICKSNFTVTLSDIKYRNINKSCGCLKKQKTQNGALRRTHGKTGSKVYYTWKAMIRRCSSTTHEKDISVYVNNGISVCERWLNFENFYLDMGEPPTPKHSIDRIKNGLGYFKENCRWATCKQQNRNTSRNVFLTYNGEIKCLGEWSEILNIPYYKLYKEFKKNKRIDYLINKQ